MQTLRKNLVSELAKALLKTNAFKIGSFATPDGKTSPYFIDLRKLPSYPEAFALAENCLEKSLSEIGNDQFEIFCGVPLTGLLLCVPLALKIRKSLFYVAGDTRKKLMGTIRPGSKVLVVDDVSETGIAITSAVQTVRSSGGVVDNALTLIDRLEGAKQALSRIEVDLHSFTNSREIASILQDRMALSEEEEKAINARPE